MCSDSCRVTRNRCLHQLESRLGSKEILLNKHPLPTTSKDLLQTLQNYRVNAVKIIYLIIMVIILSIRPTGLSFTGVGLAHNLNNSPVKTWYTSRAAILGLDLKKWAVQRLTARKSHSFPSRVEYTSQALIRQE